jgi:hypothetical protein
MAKAELIDLEALKERAGDFFKAQHTAGSEAKASEHYEAVKSLAAQAGISDQRSYILRVWNPATRAMKKELGITTASTGSGGIRIRSAGSPDDRARRKAKKVADKFVAAVLAAKSEDDARKAFEGLPKKAQTAEGREAFVNFAKDANGGRELPASVQTYLNGLAKEDEKYNPLLAFV